MIRAVLALLVLATPPAHATCAILLHGLQGRPAVMAPMAVALAEAGYVVFNAGYPSTRASIEDLADYILPRALAACPEGPVHVVGHSMGGLLFRHWQHKTDRVARLVLIGTPNAGSELVDAFADWPLYQRLMGPAAQEMGTGGIVRGLAAPKAQTAVIIGTKTRSLLSSVIIPGRDDGRVSVASANLPEAVARLYVPVDHNRLPYHPAVIAQVVRFLQTGRFGPIAASAYPPS